MFLANCWLLMRFLVITFTMQPLFLYVLPLVSPQTDRVNCGHPPSLPFHSIWWCGSDSGEAQVWCRLIVCSLLCVGVDGFAVSRDIWN